MKSYVLGKLVRSEITLASFLPLHPAVIALKLNKNPVVTVHCFTNYN